MFIPVEPGKTYTFAGHMRSTGWPAFVNMGVGGYDANRHFTFNHFASRQGTDRADQWQEAMIPFRTTDFESEVQLHIRRNDEEPDPAGCVWFDDIYLGEGVVFEDPPSRKRQFASDKIVIDSLGNFYVKKEQSMTPFFPIAVYGSHTRDDFEIYKAQGFNTYMRANSPSTMAKAAAAGLYFVLDLTRPMMNANSKEESRIQGQGLANRIEKLYHQVNGSGKRVMDNFLMYYWDNELLGKDWSVAQVILAAIQSAEKELRSERGKPAARQHPVYVLQGNFGIARCYNRIVDTNDRPLVDVMGTYVFGVDRPGSPQNADGLVALDKMPGQTAPAAFAQINDPGNVSITPADLRLRVYNALIAGAKAIGIFNDRYTRDGYKTGIEHSLWWEALPQLADEINMLHPIIQQPHWTKWQVFADADNLSIGTRDYNGKSYILVTNNNPFSVKVTFAITGDVNVKPPHCVVDHLQSGVVARVSRSKFEVTLLKHATKVYRLEHGSACDR
ncbi:MAG: hypothetical protein OEN01_05905 [Candidatus Krumholzibacteria bacterium]|nr:hypothetical protein [Candidatus Krumholzibacteria bacterium]